MPALKPRDTQQWAVLEGARRHKARWLGKLVWSTIGEIELTTDQMAEAFARAGLEADRVPEIHPRDAFRRASSQLAVDGILLEDQTRLNITIKPITEVNGRIIRAVVEHRVDANNVSLKPATVAHLIWVKEEPDEAAIIRAPQGIEPHLETSVRLMQLQDVFDAARHTFTGRSLRELAARLLTEANPVSVRRAGGVFFVPQAEAPRVTQYTRLITAFGELSRHDDTEAYAVPVVNKGEQRLMVKRAAEADIRDQIDRLVQKCHDWLENPEQKIYARSISDAFQNVQRLHTMIQTYADLTDDTLVTLKARADQALALVERVARQAE